jgi:ABC-type enterochelin transport system permease subunit
MIKLLWIACSIPVFIYAVKYFVNMELEAYGDVEPFLLVVFAFLAFAIACSGPVAVLGYIVYNILEDIAETISKNYRDRKTK